MGDRRSTAYAIAWRLVSSALIALALTFASVALPAQAAPTFQCQGGDNEAVVNACGARWEAANIRAHVAAEDYGGATAACLERTAAVLEERAAAWISANTFTPFTGPWPCGVEPPIAKADDGALAQLCPGAVWSYDNRGVANCVALVAAQAAAEVQRHLTEYPLAADSSPVGIAAGPDGALWFTESLGRKIGRITTAGALTEYPLAAGSYPQGIAAGPDGALWFTEYDGQKIGRWQR